MIAPPPPDEMDAANDTSERDRCTLLDAHWDALRRAPESDSHRPADRESPDESIAEDLEILNLLHQVQCAMEKGGDASHLSTAGLAKPSAMEAAPSGGDAGAGAPPPGETAAAMPAEPQRIGKYQVIGKVDRGGQAEVFRVIHLELAKEYVLKWALRPMATDDQAGRDALSEEARLLVQCKHPNLVTVIDLHVHEGRPFIVMEYVPGKTLQQHIVEDRPGPRRAARLVIELARVVAYLHARGIVHLDIKPRNVLIDEQGRPRLIDLGMARTKHAWCDDGPDWIGGTASSMSPEQATGCTDRIGPRTDVFGLGSLFYHLLTGRPLYQEVSSASALLQARKAGYRPIRELEPGVPRPLEQICHKALSPDPDERYPTAVELERALMRSLERRWITSGLIVLFLIAVVAFVLWPRPANSDLAPAPAAPQIVSFRILAVRGNPVQPLGWIGEDPVTIIEGDGVMVAAAQDAPSNFYLIALNTDGQVQLCLPESKSAPTVRSELSRFPPRPGFYFTLNDGPGLQAFVLVAATQPLPPFDKWEGRDGLKERWKPTATGAVWRWDGHGIEPVAGGPRGEVQERGGHPSGFEEVCKYLEKRPDIQAIRAMAFPIAPNQGTERGDRE